MTKVINLYGGPGAGKSTSAARLFALLKESGIETELISEYVKQWAWEERKPVNYDQFYFFGKQARKEYSLFGKVDYIVTDSPVALCGYYSKVFGKPEQAECFNQMISTYYNMCLKDGVEHINVFLKRVKPYNPLGRFQTEEEARKIDSDLCEYIQAQGIKFISVDGSKEGTEKLFDIILNKIYR